MPYLTTPDSMTKDCMDGLAIIYPDLVKTIPGSYSGRALLRTPIDPNRVNLIVSAGGAGGPFAESFVTSSDLCDISINGAPQAAPSAYDIYEAAKHVNSPHGYLLMCNNFMGDNLNNDLAAELLELENFKARLVTFKDDCLSVPPEAPRSERTGLIGGILYGTKIAAAASRAGASLDELVELIEHYNTRVSSMIVSFDFEEKKIMLGEGISGEPARLFYENCFTLEDAARISYDHLYQDLNPQPNEKIYFLVNRLVTTYYEDVYAFTKFIDQYAKTKHPIEQFSVGHFQRMSESYGFCVTMFCADERLDQYMNKRCITESFIL